MKKQISYIMLVDDNKIDNFFHERVINKYYTSIKVIVKECGAEALQYLSDTTNRKPDFIFLDINMPEMNGWEFLQHYQKLNIPTSNSLIVIMTNPYSQYYQKSRMLPKGIKFQFGEKPITKELLDVFFDDT
ncbi:response regulator [Flavobacterium litorale]|uniref:Response regulator n=1 Tax=Flavobacterium litorale TaxID=2856519 RepID=A0ABX8V9X9_9FLAO|nr:response regulator [Flavobacterium litorale]QYJ67630.1 response regulator [Flavobacterium litorale]